MAAPAEKDALGARVSVRWGIGSYTYGWGTGTYGASYARSDSRFLDAGELLDRAAAAGARVLQIVVRPDLLAIEREELLALATRARASGIELETGTSGTEPAHLRRHLAAAELLEARMIRTILRGEGATIERAGNELAELLPELERSGIPLAIENFEAFSSREHAALIEGLGSPAIGSCIDTVNNLGRGEGTREVLTALLPTAFCLHLKDFVSIRSKADSGFEITGTSLGTGRLPVREIVSAVLASRPRASIILEQWIPFQGTREATIDREEGWARESIEFLKSLADDAHPASSGSGCTRIL